MNDILQHELRKKREEMEKGCRQEGRKRMEGENNIERWRER